MVEIVTRKNIRQLCKPENKAELDKLIKAFAAIQELKWDDSDSFFNIAGLHGQPFRGAGYTNAQWWGGYCNHGNVLFPTWHRAYLVRLEQALQKQVPGVALPYWDEIEDATTEGEGIPGVFLQRQYTYDGGKTIDNPLFSYKFQRTLQDRLASVANYTKPIGYQTIRYPFSGLVGTPEDQQQTLVHNNTLIAMGEDQTNRILNDNVKTWLNATKYPPATGKAVPAGVKQRYTDCLLAPNYTVFSNTTSAQRWNDDRADVTGEISVVSLESPHNAIHLAIGGFDVPNAGPNSSRSNYRDANGDMGENDTASFDPIFYFHHCFIDLMFWKWQVKHSKTQSLDIIEGYPGTNSVDSQGPTPGVAGGSWLTLASPLDPFKKPDDPSTALTSNDVVDIAKLGYAYEEDPAPATGISAFAASESREPAPVLTIENISRENIKGGSFVVSAWAIPKGGGEKVLVGTEPVLSRWHVSGCANCQNHLEVRPHFELNGWSEEEVSNATFKHDIRSREKSGHKSFFRGPGDGEEEGPVCKISFGHLR